MGQLTGDIGFRLPRNLQSCCRGKPAFDAKKRTSASHLGSMTRRKMLSKNVTRCRFPGGLKWNQDSDRARKAISRGEDAPAGFVTNERNRRFKLGNHYANLPAVSCCNFERPKMEPLGNRRSAEDFD